MVTLFGHCRSCQAALLCAVMSIAGAVKPACYYFMWHAQCRAWQQQLFGLTPPVGQQDCQCQCL